MTMMFLFLFNVVLISRAFWIFYDAPINSASRPILLAAPSIQLLSLLFLQWGVGVLILLGWIILINTFTFLVEWSDLNDPAKQGLSLIRLACWLVVLGFLCSGFLDISFNSWTVKILHNIRAVSDSLACTDQSHLVKVLSYSAGIFLSVTECHIAVRFFLGIFGIKPNQGQYNVINSNNTNNKKEISRGRLIGALERLITFFFVLKGAYSALGFLIAAKGMARFKQLDQREFAEYFLVGTLLSIILAGSVALIIRHLLNAW